MVLLFGLSLLPGCSTYFGILSNRRISLDKKNCKFLGLNGKQRAMCRRDEGMIDVLKEAIVISNRSCLYEFKDERWNCDLTNSSHKKNLLKNRFKEGSFLFAVSSAGLSHAIARACSRNDLLRCSCDETTFDVDKNRETWRWGGCGDNIKYSKKFVREFLKSNRKDATEKLDRHNSDLGVLLVKKGMKKTCKCHGISATCSTKTCWKQLAPFQNISRLLQHKYNTAQKVKMENGARANDGPGLLVRGTSAPRKPHSTEMVYRDQSPDFCKPTPHSPGTGGRRCRKDENCDSLCCGRGYDTKTEEVETMCRCKFIWCCDVKCDVCYNTTEVYTCKRYVPPF
uniref:Protein Wnt n=1 Tax=Himerometra robustipinna TaxID=706653 RepID=A0A5B8GVF2_9ECHI|nr:Wnt9 [Himerometra robustipinna]